MTNLPDLIIDAIEDGINRELLLRELQLDSDSFTLKMESSGFDPEESRLLRRVIKQWRCGE